MGYNIEVSEGKVQNSRKVDCYNTQLELHVNQICQLTKN
jgi:hypothetical protein